MKKNTAGQSTSAQMTSATDGSNFTGTVTVYVTGDNGTQTIGSVGSGICTHEGNGLHSYAPSQAETNYDHVDFTFIGTGAITVTRHEYPEFPQTGDAYAIVNNGTYGNAAIKTQTGAIETDTAEIGAAGAGLTALAQASIWTSTIAGRIDAAISTRSTLTQTQVTGGAYALQTDASGYVKISSGTGTGQLDFTSGRIKADVAYFGGAAGTFDSGIPDVNTVKISGTAQTARDIGASVLLSPGTGTGQVSITSGVVSANMVQISGDATAADTLELFAEALDQSTGQLDSGSLASGTITAASLASDAGTEIATAVWASGTRTLTSLGTDTITADVLATSAVNEITAAIWAKTVDGITFESWAIAMLAVMTGVTDLVDADNVAFKNQSGSTKVTVTYGTNPGERDVVVIA